MNTVLEKNEPVLLFDGVCNLCQSSVQFILKNEKNSVLKFTAIQSESGRKLVDMYGIDPKKTDSVIFIEKGQAYTESDAVLTVTGYLKFPWSIGRFFKVVPRGIRNAVYKKIAKNRYRWFGKQESCMMPTPELKRRFLP